MYKKWIFGCLPLFIASVAFSQAADRKTDRLHKDPQTAERAAKADVLIRKKNTVTYDSAAVTQDKKAACTKAKKQQPARKSLFHK